MFLIVFGQQSRSTAQRNKIYQALDTHTTLCRDQFIIGLALHMRFVDNKKKTENHQLYPLMSKKPKHYKRPYVTVHSG